MADASRPKRLVGVSTKMYFSLKKTSEYTSEFLSVLQQNSQVTKDVDIFIIPDFISIPSVVSLIKQSGLPVMTGAQDCHYEDVGAFTGEVSASQISEAGCRIIELGHAERRRIFGETDVEASKKAAAAARNNCIPLICIGEKNKGPVDSAVKECAVQVQAVKDSVPADKPIILAYEPVWAIGASKPADEEHVVGVTKELREMCADRTGETRVLYGGSAGPGLFEKIKDGVDGLFLGRFAHDPKQFIKTIQEIGSA